MKSKIELVARAICIIDSPDEDPNSSTGGWYRKNPQNPQFRWQLYIPHAQAAIRAIQDADDFDMKFISMRGQIHKRDCALVISKENWGCDCKEEENKND